MRPIIRVEGLGKQYRIGALHANYMTFREMLGGAIAGPFKRLRGQGRQSPDILWALKNVSFEVAPGEVVGLIGHNGAGKSTLLKILSRITEPTSGYFEVYGRVGSLLEVGTGFHPDLTGRDNVFLNGAILGVSRSKIARKFDEIVAFSEIEKFIDTPVKWYSTGMYLRLAFSVAVHLEPEILIMDEVLAVGDVSFQQKCLDKMHAVMKEGRTILFVSHSMPSITRLCTRAILIDKGSILHDGPAHQVVNEYLGSSWKITEECEWPTLDEAPGNEAVRLRKVRVRNEDGETTAAIDIRLPVGIEFVYEVLKPGHVLVPKLDLFNEEGAHIFAAHDVGTDWRRHPRSVGRYISTAWIPGNYLAAGNLLVHASLVSHTPATTLHAHAPNVVTFQVIDSQDGDTARGDYVGPIPGVVRPVLNWTTHSSNSKSPVGPVPEEIMTV